METSKTKNLVGAVVGLIVSLAVLLLALKAGECTIENNLCLDKINSVVDEAENTTEAVLDF